MNLLEYVLDLIKSFLGNSNSIGLKKETKWSVFWDHKDDERK